MSAAPSSPRARSPRRASSRPGRPRPTGRSRWNRGMAAMVVRLEDDHCVAPRAVLLATGAEYRRLPVANLEESEGSSVFYAAGPPEAQRCRATRVGVVGGGNSAAQAAIWLARGGAVVTLLHRRADLRETMSEYLIHDLDRYGVTVHDGSEIAELHGADGQLEAVTLRSGERLQPLLPLPLPLSGRLAVHDLAARQRGLRRARIRAHRVRRERRRVPRDESPRSVRGRRRPIRADQAMRDCSGRALGS